MTSTPLSPQERLRRRAEADARELRSWREVARSSMSLHLQARERIRRLEAQGADAPPSAAPPARPAGERLH